ncbi:hypothetical protein BN189_4430001 [Clostridioides difficile T10]|nr:hypothetical protein BN189_4430001 [Clostridioides difficile T10]
MNCFCRFPFDKPRIGNIDSHNENNHQEKSDVESRRRKTAFCYASYGLYALSDTVRHIVNKIQLVGFLYHIACRIAKVQADYPDKISDTV